MCDKLLREEGEGVEKNSAYLMTSLMLKLKKISLHRARRRKRQGGGAGKTAAAGARRTVTGKCFSSTSDHPLLVSILVLSELQARQ